MTWFPGNTTTYQAIVFKILPFCNVSGQGKCVVLRTELYEQNNSFTCYNCLCIMHSACQQTTSTCMLCTSWLSDRHFSYLTTRDCGGFEGHSTLFFTVTMTAFWNFWYTHSKHLQRGFTESIPLISLTFFIIDMPLAKSGFASNLRPSRSDFDSVVAWRVCCMPTQRYPSASISALVYLGP